MKYQVISSGSKGNLIYIESKEAKVVIDAGICLKSVKERCNVDLKGLDAILVTHEHVDHVGYLHSYMNKLNAPAYINEDSYHALLVKQKNMDYSGLLFNFIKQDSKYQIKDLIFMPLGLSHDTVNCYGYVFREGDKSLAYIADTGYIPLEYIELLKNVDHIIIESNHDIKMLNDSDRPFILKQRILSMHGHLSNITSGDVLNTILKSKKCKHITLCHLSEECNSPEVALETVKEHIKGKYAPPIVTAKQHEALPLMEI